MEITLKTVNAGKGIRILCALCESIVDTVPDGCQLAPDDLQCKECAEMDRMDAAHQDRLGICPICNGTGRRDVGEECSRCAGTGELYWCEP